MRFFSFLTVQPGDDAIARRARWLIIALTTWLAIEMFVSLHWRLALDSPLLYYFAFLQEQYGFVPYRDFFDTSFPGAIFFYRALTAVTGYSDLAFRLCDLALLLALLAMSYHLLSTLGRDAARFSVVIFGLVYLGHGFYMSMEREFVALLPVAAALLVATQATRVSNVQRLLLVGALFGVAASIKPHLALGVLPVLGYLAVRDHHDGCTSDLVIAILRNGIIALSGFTIMFALPLLWLWWRGGLPAFSEIVQHYLPLYLNLNGDREKMSGSVRLLYLVKQWRLGQAPFWMAASIISRLPAGASTSGLVIGEAADALASPASTGDWGCSSRSISTTWFIPILMTLEGESHSRAGGNRDVAQAGALCPGKYLRPLEQRGLPVYFFVDCWDLRWSRCWQIDVENAG